jgi:hypothetical protein
MVIRTLLKRFSAVLVLLIFTYTSCSNPVLFDSKEEKTPFDPLNPGEGTAVYSYIGADGKVSDTDYGKTLFTIENNKHAEGVFVYSDDTKEDYSRVTILYKDINIIMFFKDDSGFPTSMNIQGLEENYKGYFSTYNYETQTYNIMIEQDNNYEMLKNIYLEKDLLTKYEEDPDKTPSQNKRIRNYTVSLSVYYSLYNYFKSKNTTNDVRSARSIKGFFDKLKDFFVVVAIVVLIVIIICFPPLIILVQVISGLTPPEDPPPKPQEQEEKLCMTIEWGDDPQSITRSEDLLHFKKDASKYTIHVEIYGDSWNEANLNELINANYCAYSPGEKYGELKTIDYFALNDDKPYKIIKDTSTCKKFDIKFTRDPLEPEYKTELRIGLVFKNELVINSNYLNVKFYGNIDDEPDYTSVKPEENKYINETFSYILTMRFCLYNPSDCMHFQ